MLLRDTQETFTFDDLTLVPQYSEIDSREHVDVSVPLCKGFKFSSPLIPANMSTVSGKKMVLHTYNQKSLGILHRFMEYEEKMEMLKSLKRQHEDIFDYVGISIGVKESDYTELDAFIGMGVKIICVDVAHLDSKIGLAMVKHLATKYPTILSIVGTVATYSATLRAFEHGADVVRVGISGGSICTTREETGNGVPQVSAIADAAAAKRYYMQYGREDLDRQVFLISDGGITKPADFCKALCFTDMVIAGNIFAGTSEAPGQIVEIGGASYAHYDGSSTHKNNRVEGVKALVPIKGSAKEVFNRMHQGLQSCCSYQNSKNLQELKNKAQFMRVTNAGSKEGAHHNVLLRETR